MLAVFLAGVLATFAMMTFHTVSRGWQASQDYMDKMQRVDFAIGQITAALRSMYYPHEGSQDASYGFVLVNGGDGEDPDDSDTIEWSKRGAAIVGNRSNIGDSVHRVKVMVLKEGNRDFKEDIEVTGLYARLCPDAKLRPSDGTKDVDYSFANDEMYQPVLIADGIVGFNCRVVKSPDDVKAGKKNDESAFEDEFAESNSVPYKVELKFRIASRDDPDRYRLNTAPVMRIVRIPVYEQSTDGAAPPSAAAKGGRQGRRGGGK